MNYGVKGLNFMVKILWIVLLFTVSLFSLDLDHEHSFNELLSHSEIYKDFTKTETIESIQTKKFSRNNEQHLGFGYSPNFDVWVKFTLTNKSSHSINKLIEYDNPLISSVTFYENGTLQQTDGLLATLPHRKSLNPTFQIALKPHESKLFYIKASSKITTLIVKLNIWSIEEFNKKEMHNQIMLALFFGAMGIIVLYNSIIFLLTKERSYFYYILFFTSVGFHHLMYKGVANIYFFSAETMHNLINYSSIIVAMPTVALALFTQHILKLEQYPKLNKGLIVLFILYPLFILAIQISEFYQYRSLFFFLVLLYLFFITLYALLKKNRAAPLIFVAWILFVSSGMAMYFSSLGIYSIFEKIPYYTELSLLMIMLIFSGLLASKIKNLNQEKLNATKNAFLLKELNHRVKNSMQIILSILTLQKNKTNESAIEEILLNLEKRIVASTELYSLLETKENMTVINMHSYFSLIVNNIKKSFKKDVMISIDSSMVMDSEYAMYAGLIVNEAVTNAFKHSNCTHVSIVLEEKQTSYELNIKDNGTGFSTMAQEHLGLGIIDTLATLQLDGDLNIITNQNGVQINIKWRKDERD